MIANSPTTKRRRDTELRMLRYLPGDSVVHRLWAGTKIVVAAAVSLALSLRPTWRALGRLVRVRRTVKVEDATLVEADAGVTRSRPRGSSWRTAAAGTAAPCWA